jgi:hypothetical protein
MSLSAPLRLRNLCGECGIFRIRVPREKRYVPDWPGRFPSIRGDRLAAGHRQDARYERHGSCPERYRRTTCELALCLLRSGRRRRSVRWSRPAQAPSLRQVMQEKVENTERLLRRL